MRYEICEKNRARTGFKPALLILEIIRLTGWVLRKLESAIAFQFIRHA
jgi:hypothetical protein